MMNLEGYIIRGLKSKPQAHFICSDEHGAGRGHHAMHSAEHMRKLIHERLVWAQARSA